MQISGEFAKLDLWLTKKRRGEEEEEEEVHCNKRSVLSRNINSLNKYYSKDWGGKRRVFLKKYSIPI